MTRSNGGEFISAGTLQDLRVAGRVSEGIENAMNLGKENREAPSLRGVNLRRGRGSLRLEKGKTGADRTNSYL